MGLFKKRGKNENDSDDGVGGAPSGSDSDSNDCYVVVTRSSSSSVDGKDGRPGSGGCRTRKNRGVLRDLNLLRPEEGAHCLYPKCPPSAHSKYSLRDLDLRSAASVRDAGGGGARRAVRFVRRDWEDLSSVVATRDVLLSDRVVNVTAGTGVGGGGGASASVVTYRQLCALFLGEKRGADGSLKSRD